MVVKAIHGQSQNLLCLTDGNPSGIINWYHTNKDSLKRQNLQVEEPALVIDRMDNSKQGTYECLIENSIGAAKRSFDVFDYPKGKFNLNHFLI